MAITFQREGFHPFYEDSAPLLAAHWEEVSHYPDIPLEVDVPLYERAEAAGMLRVFTVRDEAMDPAHRGQILGYAVFFVATNAHYSGSLQAKQDVLFLSPQFRGGNLGIRLVKFADEQLKADGVQVVYQHQKLAHPALGAVLLRRGYEPVETLWAIRLDREG